MWKRKLLVAAFLPWTICALPDGAFADVQAVLACRRLPPGPARTDCLERATADLEQAAAAPDRQTRAAGQGARRPSRDRFAAGVSAITYQDGRPVFRLDNGQTWYSVDRRRLTFKPGRSHVTIEKTPVGMLLHYNGSFFGLKVVPKQD